MIGRKILNYEIKKLLGEGGMGNVYLAEHTQLGRKVAIKTLKPLLSGNAQIRERFKNEAKMMASLDHPNITKVIDLDEQSEQLSIVMEYLSGSDLDEIIKKQGALSEEEAKAIFTQTLSAFQYAHENGIVHRDIKPSNIFVLPNGTVKILDFGIAKLFGQGNEMTQTGAQMGTPIYMSPEQVKGDKSIDHRSDIYSLGVTMFYAINGKAPYDSESESQFDIFNKIVYEPIPDTTKNVLFKDIISLACKKDRALRAQDCTELLDILNSKKQSATTRIDKTIVNTNQDTQVNNGVLQSNNSSAKTSSDHPEKRSENIEADTAKILKVITWAQIVILVLLVIFNTDNFLRFFRYTEGIIRCEGGGDFEFAIYYKNKQREIAIWIGALITCAILINFIIRKTHAKYLPKLNVSKFEKYHRMISGPLIIIGSIIIWLYVSSVLHITISIYSIYILAFYLYILLDLILLINALLKTKNIKNTTPLN